MNWYRACQIGQLVSFVVVMLLAAFALLADAQTVRQGEKLPSGPPRYYLREGSMQEICAPYGDPKKPSWSCAEAADVIRLILKEPPDCGAR